MKDLIEEKQQTEEKDTYEIKMQNLINKLFNRLEDNYMQFRLTPKNFDYATHEFKLTLLAVDENEGNSTLHRLILKNDYITIEHLKCNDKAAISPSANALAKDLDHTLGLTEESIKGKKGYIEKGLNYLYIKYTENYQDTTIIYYY